MQSEPLWLPVSEVVDTNRDLVEETGEPHHIRDLGLLESACAVPRNQWSYGGVTDLATLATSVLFAIARNHPFMQGNKRTALLAALQLLELNGWALADAIDSMQFADRIVAVIEGAAEEDEITDLLRANSQAP